MTKTNFSDKKSLKSKKSPKFATTMMWVDSVDAIDMMMKGVLVGIVTSAPMGPVGVLTVQRTLNKGRWYGFVTGVGATVSDLIYAMITGLGMSFMLEFVEKPSTMLYSKLLGGIMLFFFGLYAYKSTPSPPHRPSGKMGSLTHNALTGFFVTLSNPLIIFLFMALFARFNFICPDRPLEQFVGFLGLVAGALLWWLSLTSALQHLGNRVQMDTVRLLNRLLGALVMSVSVIGLALTLINDLWK